MFSAHISTGDRVFTEIAITDADPKYIAGLGRLIGDLVELVKADADQQPYAIDTLAQRHLFGESGEEVR